MSNIVINTERFDDLIAKKRDEIEKIEIFKASKIDIINSQLSNFEKFLKPYGSNMEIHNMYVSNGEKYDVEYTMIAHIKFTLTKEYKNASLLCSKLKASFDSNVDGIRGSFVPYKIKGNVVDFEIYL